MYMSSYTDPTRYEVPLIHPQDSSFSSVHDNSFGENLRDIAMPMQHQRYPFSTADNSSVMYQSEANDKSYIFDHQDHSSHQRSSISLDSLSLHPHHVEDWLIPLHLNNQGYDPSDMNFFFTSNQDLLHNKEVITTITHVQSSINNTTHTMHPNPTQSVSSNSSNDSEYLIQLNYEPNNHPSKAHEHFRRSSMLELSRDPTPDYGHHQNQPSKSHSSYTQAAPKVNAQKERASMPNVFHQVCPNQIKPQNKQPKRKLEGQLTWHPNNLMEKRMTNNNKTSYPSECKINSMPAQSSYSTPSDLICYTETMSSTNAGFEQSASFTAEGLSKDSTTKRSLIEQVLEDDFPYPMAVVSNLSEPMPEQNIWVSEYMPRKRTKSIQSLSHSIGNSHDISTCVNNNNNDNISSSGSEIDDLMVEPSYSSEVINFTMPDLLDSFDTTTYPNEYEINTNNHMLSAMPRRQKLRYDGDDYTPKWVRFTGHLKEGFCDSCSPGKWLQLKNSAYWYHKQFYHGISSVSGKPFMKPVEQRMGKGDMIEGLCHQCHRFIPACNGKKKNNYMLWYRHAHKCHLYEKPKSTSKTIRKLSTSHHKGMI